MCGDTLFFSRCPAAPCRSRSLPLWPEVGAERIAEPVFGGHAYLYQAGEGKARRIVLVHGIGDNGARDFPGLIPWLVAQGFHVLTFDLPGFGRSDKANVLYSPGNYAAFVKYVADRYARRPFTLFGHSMGGVVALRYAADHPTWSGWSWPAPRASCTGCRTPASMRHTWA